MPPSDGCTGVPDGQARVCCVAHDVAYAARVPRAQADALFRDCLRRQGLPIRAVVYWLGVRAFGWWSYHRCGPRLRSFLRRFHP